MSGDSTVFGFPELHNIFSGQLYPKDGLCSEPKTRFVRGDLTDVLAKLISLVVSEGACLHEGLNEWRQHSLPGFKDFEQVLMQSKHSRLYRQNR